MHRRGLLGLGAGAAASVLAGCAVNRTQTASTPLSTPIGTPTPTATPTPTPSAPTLGPPTGLAKLPLPVGKFNTIPETGKLFAMTVDDGENGKVLKGYCDLAAATGMRLTFFANGSSSGWRQQADAVRPLVESGQVFIGNHTWSHPYLTKISDAEIETEIRRNEEFLYATFGVTGRPFCRPPFGAYDARVTKVLARLGYPSIAMWSGSIGDSTPVTPEFIIGMAKQYFTPGKIVLGHADFENVLSVIDQFATLIAERGLQPVHLGDVYDVGDAATKR
jgi:peptidoglycan-N-acetylglucosamine deacetylase